MSTDSVIHDIGYQRYTGERLGRGYAVRSLYIHGVRTVFGFGRPAKAKIFPWAIYGVLIIVATVDVSIRARTGIMPLSYLEYCRVMAVPVLLFLAAVAPELVSRDLRNNVLPLYFSRPLKRSDYAWAKLAAAISGAWLLYAGPLLLIFVAGAFTVNGFHLVWHEFTDFLGGLGLAGIYALVFGSLALVIAAFIRRRMVAAAVIVGFFLVMDAIGAVVGNIIGPPSGENLGQMIGPVTLIRGLYIWLYNVGGGRTAFGGPPPAVGPGPDGGVVKVQIAPFHVNLYGPQHLIVAIAIVVVSAVLLQLRYRKASA